MTNALDSLPLLENEPLADHTTIGIGGPARFFLRCKTKEELEQGIVAAREMSLPLFILGGGSNLLVSDAGFPGLVIQMALGGIELQDDGDTVLATGGAGVVWDAFVQYCVEQNLQGIECLSGIPGQVGAAPIQNIGAYGQEVAETIETVEALDLETLETVRFTNNECHFSYRMSRFKGEDQGRYVVTAVTFRLHPGALPTLRYGDVQKYFADHDTPPTLQEIRDAVIEIRSGKGMVISPTDPDSRSCGSFFMNPIITLEERNRVHEIVTKRFGVGTRFPEFPVKSPNGDPTHVKLSAAWLMEKAGLQKGMRHKGAGLSTKHVLALINADNATASDVHELIATVQKTVQKEFGIILHPEPVLLRG